jgi:hypothetical protein
MVSTTPPRNDYTGTGSVSTYSYTFRIFAATDLRVTTQDTAGVEAALSYPTDYSVTGVNKASGGTITLTGGNLTSGYKLTIRFDRTPRQSTDLRNQGGFFAQTHEDKFDELTRYVQQNEDVLDRSIKLPETEVGTPDATTLPAAANRASKYFAWNSSGVPIPVDPESASGTSVLAIGTTMARLLADWWADWYNVKSWGAIGNGVALDQTALAAAVLAAFTDGKELYWPKGTYVSNASIPNFHNVRHRGPGVVKRGTDLWVIGPDRTTVRKTYISPSGNNANDGLSSTEPLATIQQSIDRLHQWGPIVGRHQLILAAGSYGEVITIPKFLATNENYLEIKGPAAPGVRGDPAAWPGGGAIIDGSGMPTTSNGVTVNQYNNVYFEYILFRDWFNGALSATDQVISAVVLREFTNVYCYGCSAIGNGLSNISMLPFSNVIITGGIFSGARQGINNIGGNLSFTSSGADFTTIKLAEEYGLHSKHQASTVLDFTEFLDNGQNAAAATYGAAIFAYKTNTSVDTRSCVFRRNNIVYSARGGYISTHPSSPDTLGTGADLNDRVWNIRGYGADDLMNYRSLAGREMSLSHGGNVTTGAVTALIFDTNALLPTGYLRNNDQHVEIEIFATNGAGGTAQVRPSFVSGAGTRYELANFQIAASTNAHIRLIVQTSTDGTVATVWYASQGATIGGLTSGVITVNPVVFNTDTMEMQVWGETSAGNSLSIRKTRVVLWG